MCSARFLVLASLFINATPAVVHAGMPSLRLTDVAKMRLESISFFLVGFLLCAGLIQLLWNWLRKDFAFLPRLSYPKAVGLVTLWGLLFVLVLTMISGARELMTPGAWEKNGLTYRLAKPPLPPQPSDEDERRSGLERLRIALWKHADSNKGRFPESATGTEIASELWLVPGPSGMKYIYVGGQSPEQKQNPLAYEPELNGSKRMVLLTTGEVRHMEWRELASLLKGGGPP